MLLLLLILAGVAQAEFLRIEMGFGGMECASCSQFIENRFSRNPGVESVSIDKQKGAVILKLKPGNKVRLTQVRDFVQQSGFTPKDALVVVRGVPEVEQGSTSLRIDGIGTVRLQDPRALLRAWTSKIVEITGQSRIITHEGQKAGVIEVEKAELIMEAAPKQ